MKPIRMLSQVVGDAVGSLHLIIFAITIYDVAMRYLFASPTIWGLELVIALAGIQYVMGGAQALKDDAHVRIDFIYQLLPKRVQAVMDVISTLVIMALLGIIIFYGYRNAQISWMRGETSGAGWNSHAPMIMKMAIPLGAALMFLQAFEILIEKIKGVRDVR